MRKVIIAFGSRYGSTEEISNFLSRKLEENGLKTTIINIDDTKSFDSINLDEYDGILLGSGIKIGKWTKSAKAFLEYIKAQSFEKKKVIGAFVSSGEAGNPEKVSDVRKNYVENVLKELDIKIDVYDAFGGVIDLSENSKLGFVTKKMLKVMAKKDPYLKVGERNDGRDWDQIKNFAEKYIKLVKSKN